MSALAVLALGAAVATKAAPATTLSLQEAFARALQSGAAVGRQREELAAAEASRRAIFSLVLPRVNVTGSLVRNSDEVSFGSDSDSRTILPRNDWNYRLVLQQPVFAGLREKRAYSQSKVAAESAREGLRAAEDATLLRVAGDYLGVVNAEALLDVEQRNLALAQERRTQAQNLFEAGETTRVEVLRAETAIKAAARRLVAARQARNVSLGRLRVDLALDGGELAVSEPKAVARPLPDEATLARVAERERPDLRQAAQAVEIARLEVSKQKGAYLPVITADAGYVHQKTTFPKDQYGFAALRFTVPVFQSGEIGARVAAARARQRAAELQLAEQRRIVREDVRTTLLAVEAARTNLALAEEQLATAEADYAQTFERYRGQEATALDLEAAENSVGEARRSVVTGRLDLQLAELQAWAAAGSLKDALSAEDAGAPAPVLQEVQ